LRGWTQRELAARVKRSQAWLSRVERGAANALVTPHDVAELMRELGCRAEDLFVAGDEEAG